MRKLATVGLPIFRSCSISDARVLTRIPLHLFDHNRHTKQWDLLQSGEDYPRITLEGLPNVVNQAGGDVIVRISISYPVTLRSH